MARHLGIPALSAPPRRSWEAAKAGNTPEYNFHAEMQAHFGLPRNSIIPLLHEYEDNGCYVPPALPPRRRNLFPLLALGAALACWVLLAFIVGALTHV